MEHTWEEYRAKGVQGIIDIIDEGKGWMPSIAQVAWLQKYANKQERIELVKRNVL